MEEIIKSAGVWDDIEELLPKGFDVGGLVLNRNAVNTFTTRVKATDGGDLNAALRAGNIVCIEATDYGQLPKEIANEDCDNFGPDAEERYDSLEMTYALPGARLGEVTDVDGQLVFAELPIYNRHKWQRYTRQTPVMYGQQMRANSPEVERTREIMVAAGWKTIEFGQSTRPVEQRTTRRLPRWRLAPPLPEALQTADTRQYYRNALSHRQEHGLQVASVMFTSADEQRIEDLGEFSDPFHVLQRGMRNLIKAEASNNPAEVENAFRLLASMTGSRYDEDLQRVFPIRAGNPQVTFVDHAELNYWVVKAAATDSGDSEVPPGFGGVDLSQQ